jgi:hypothetical protein
MKSPAIGFCFIDRVRRAESYGKAWAPYVWPVTGISDLKAPFIFSQARGASGTTTITSGTWVWQTA